MTTLPPIDELLASAHVVSLPMRVRFRGVDAREVLLLEGPSGWGEFSPFVEYPDAESARWLLAGIEAAYAVWPAPVRDAVAVNATVPAVRPERVPEVLARFDGTVSPPSGPPWVRRRASGSTPTAGGTSRLPPRH